MFEKLIKKNKQTKLEREIDSVIDRMSKYPPDSKEYTEIANNIERLYKAKAYEGAKCVTPDTIAVIAGNLLGIVLILSYEKANVITSKALGFVLRGRV